MSKFQKSGQRAFYIFMLSTVLFGISVNAIRCYQCTSVSDTRCTSLKHDNTSLEFYQDCNENYYGKPPFCRKTVQTIIDEEQTVRVHRSCGWEAETPNSQPCHTYENDFHTEVVCVCWTDGCNAAPPSLTPLALLVTAMAASTTILHR